MTRPEAAAAGLVPPTRSPPPTVAIMMAACQCRITGTAGLGSESDRRAAPAAGPLPLPSQAHSGWHCQAGLSLLSARRGLRMLATKLETTITVQA